MEDKGTVIKRPGYNYEIKKFSDSCEHNKYKTMQQKMIINN